MKKYIVFTVLAVSLVFGAVEAYGQTFPKDPVENYENGLMAIKLGSYEAAIIFFDEAIKLKPNYEDAYFARGRSYYETKNFDKAIADITKAIQLNPKDADYYYWRGALYYIVIDYNRALADANAALRINPNHKKAKDLVAEINKKSSSPSQPAARPAQPAPPPPPAPVYVTQTCSTCNGTKKENCILCGGKGSITFGGYTSKGGFGVPDIYIPGTSFPCTNSWCVNGKVDCTTCGGKGTVQVLQTAAQPAQPTPAPQPAPAPAAVQSDKAAYDRGKAAYDQNNYDRAITEFTEAIRLNSNNGLAYFYRADSYGMKNDNDRALADVNQAIRINPNDVNFYYLRGLMYHRKSDYDRAIADFNQTLKMDPNYGKGLAHYWRADSYVVNKDYDRALADINQAIRLNPNDANYYYTRGVAYSWKDDYDRAIADFNQALKIDPNNERAKKSIENTRQRKQNSTPAPAPANSVFEMNGTTLVKYNGSAANVTIPSNVTVIGKDAFESKNLTSVTIPNSVTSIGTSAFSSNKLTSVTIPNSVTSIGSFAFSDNKLTSVNIPNSVTSIEYGAFEHNQLASVTIPNSVTSIEGSAFSYNKLTSVTIPNSVTSIGAYAFHCESLTSIEVASDNAHFSSVGGILFNKDKTKLIMYPRGKSSGGTYTIPNNVTSIEAFAFGYCKITGIVIPNSVTSIGRGAFGGNNLSSVTIPNSVTSIGDLAFQDNEQLNSVTIGANVNVGKGVCRRFAGKEIIDGGFEEFYVKNGKKAGTYTYDGKNWSAKNAPARPAPAAAQEQLPPRGVVYPEFTNPNAIPLSAWKPSDGESPGVTKRGFLRKEVIDGQERDTFSMEVTFPRETNAGGTSKWGAFTINDENNLPKFRTATGVRFKAQGDGKRWIIQFHTKESMTDWGSYEAEIQTVPNRVVEINIPYSSLAQPGWAKKVPFVKSNIVSVNLQRMTDTASETGASTLKVFDFEVYSDSSSASAAPAPAAKPDEIITSNAGWEPNKDSSSSANVYIRREQIDGKEWNVLTVDVNLAGGSGGRWAGAMNWDENTISKFRNARGVRFKVQGDGKKWIVYFATSDVKDDAYHRVIISTQNGKVSSIDIPFNTLKQPDWKKKSVTFVTGNLSGMAIERNPEMGTGASTLKVFNFEIY